MVLSCDVLLMASRICLTPFTEGSMIAALTYDTLEAQRKRSAAAREISVRGLSRIAIKQWRRNSLSHSCSWYGMPRVSQSEWLFIGWLSKKV